MEGAALLLAIADLILKYGPEAAIKLINAWSVENPAMTDIQALRDMKPAESYFEEKPE